MKFRTILAGFAFALVGAASANATVLVTYTDDPTAETGFFGESVTTPVGGPFDNIMFNFYETVTHNGVVTLTPEANGTLFVFASAYTGLPTGLSSATPGLLAMSTGNAGSTVYSFLPSFTLTGNTQYFFYEARSQTADYATSGGYAGGDIYFTSVNTSDFAVGAQDADFTLQGTPVPEPLTLSLFGAGVGGLAFIRRKRKKTA